MNLSALRPERKEQCGCYKTTRNYQLFPCAERTISFFFTPKALWSGLFFLDKLNVGFYHNGVMKRTIRVAFTDWWEGFNPLDNVWLKALRCYYDVIVDEQHPEYVFYSCFGSRYMQYREAILIFYSGEPIFPNFNVCDYAYSNIKYQCMGRVVYLPSALTYFETSPELPPIDAENDCHRSFCSFIYANDYFGEGAVLRKKVCQYIMDHYAFVHCPGRVLHNCEAEELSERYDIQQWHKSKLPYMSQFKFNIAYENHSIRGYITEKLIDCFLSNTVPIYYGSEGDLDIFPKNAMICAHDYKDEEALLARIKEVNENDDLYLEMLRANPFRQRGMETFQSILSRTLPDIIEHGTKLIKGPRGAAVNNTPVKPSVRVKRKMRSVLARLMRLLDD